MLRGRSQIIPIPHMGGHYGPDDHKQLYSLYKIMARATKILVLFLSMFVWSQESCFWISFFENLKKMKKDKTEKTFSLQGCA